MSLLRPRAARLSLVLLLAVAASACDSGSGKTDSNDTIVLGVNLTRLFAQPTEAEIQAVVGQWGQRSTTALNAEVVGQAAVPGGTAYVVRHTTRAGGSDDVVHYGVVRVPTGAQRVPVLVVHHGGDQGFGFGDGNANTNPNAAATLFPSLFSKTVQVYPTYRSETLRTTGTSLAGPYTSGGQASPWDYDVDDSIALVNAVLALPQFAPFVDGARIAAMGFSRGANTAVLHAIRDPRIKAVTDYYGPTDFYNPVVTSTDPSSQGLAVGLLTGLPQVLGLPGAQYLRNSLLLPLQGPNGTYNANADYAGARLEVIRRSASVFTGRIRDLQIHHHEQDPVVPFPFSQALDAVVKAKPNAGRYEFNAYTGAIPAGIPPPGYAHQPEALVGASARTEAFLSAALGLGSPTVAPARPLAL